MDNKNQKIILADNFFFIPRMIFLNPYNSRVVWVKNILTQYKLYIKKKKRKERLVDDVFGVLII